MRRELKELFKHSRNPDQSYKSLVNCPFSKGESDPHYVEISTKKRQPLIIYATCDKRDKSIVSSAEGLGGECCSVLKQIIISVMHSNNYYDRGYALTDKVKDRFADIGALRHVLKEITEVRLKEVHTEEDSPDYANKKILQKFDTKLQRKALVHLATGLSMEDITFQTSVTCSEKSSYQKYKLYFRIGYKIVAERDIDRDWHIHWDSFETSDFDLFAKETRANLKLGVKPRCELCNRSVNSLVQHSKTDMHETNLNKSILIVTRLFPRSDKPINYKLVKRVHPHIDIAHEVRKLCSQA